ncbi:MAG TPA: hypothetical protein VFF32_01320 [Dermatophilaceae bacterium]|nr:hypothetical protein [Dermatophilaceae bacterium]
MKVSEVLNTARDTITVKRVYAEPYEQDGVTIIPAAVVGGGAGEVVPDLVELEVAVPHLRPAEW